MVGSDQERVYEIDLAGIAVQVNHLLPPDGLVGVEREVQVKVIGTQNLAVHSEVPVAPTKH